MYFWRTCCLLGSHYVLAEVQCNLVILPASRASNHRMMDTSAPTTAPRVCTAERHTTTPRTTLLLGHALQNSSFCSAARPAPGRHPATAPVAVATASHPCTHPLWPRARNTCLDRAGADPSLRIRAPTLVPMRRHFSSGPSSQLSPWLRWPSYCSVPCTSAWVRRWPCTRCTPPVATGSHPFTAARPILPGPFCHSAILLFCLPPSPILPAPS